MQYCKIISLDNNNSVKFTSSRGDHSITNDSMVMKISHAQLHMYTNIMYKFQSSTRKTGGENVLLPEPHYIELSRMDRQTDDLTDSHGDSSIPPPLFCGGYNKRFLWHKMLPDVTFWKYPHFEISAYWICACAGTYHDGSNPNMMDICIPYRNNFMYISILSYPLVTIGLYTRVFDTP